MPALAFAQGIIYDRAPGFSITILLELMFICVASGLVFFALVRRWTSHRHWISLSEWAQEHGFKSKPIARDELPAPLVQLSAVVRLSLSGKRGTLLQLQAGVEPSQAWNVLARRTTGAWIPSGLRPSAAADSLLDRLGLTTYPAYSTQERFHLISADNSAARKLAKNSARALLPADVGLLLWGEWLILDFTTRPFDPIEFGRMLSLADQVARVVEV